MVAAELQRGGLALLSPHGPGEEGTEMNLKERRIAKVASYEGEIQIGSTLK